MIKVYPPPPGGGLFIFIYCHMNKLIRTLALLLALVPATSSAQLTFTQVPPAQSGVLFQNKLIESPALNIITYEYYYNGGGVAAADFNNDGLTDLFFTANLLPNTLYLNKGDWKFEDISRKAGVEGKKGWKTGVSVADVNADGYLDIYVCYSGDLEPKQRKNQLYINNKDLTFTEQSEFWGIADAGYTTQALFFDYDRDNDLDLFVLNHNIKNLRNFDAAFVKKMVDEGAGDRLYRNDGTRFTDVTVSAGIISNPLGYGLSVIASDINNDGWADLYVTNDYVEEDYLYINNGDGTFRETLKSSTGHISNFSMGADIADVNNDGWMDIYTLDMLPADNRRQKLLYAPDNYELYNNQVQNGFHHQLMRNMLQVNNGDNTFSETGQFSGISNTDWSWSSLFADLNNDGQKDLFVTNGYGRDMINRDFMKFYANERLKFMQGQQSDRMFQMLQGIQTTPVHDYLFMNNGGLKFTDISISAGFGEEDLSHGAVYADLDNDGDLDLVVNRMNTTAVLYRNQWKEKNSAGNYIQLQLSMPGKNTGAIGSRVIVYTPKGNRVQEHFPIHGFQSSMNGPMHIGLPSNQVDSVVLVWPDGNRQVVRGLAVNALHKIVYNQELPAQWPAPNSNFIFKAGAADIPFTHRGEKINDFKNQPLLPQMLSNAGPRIVVADVNKDGLEDMYICGGRGQYGKLMIQQRNGNFVAQSIPGADYLGVMEELDAIFFDADNDKDPDLYVVSGDYALPNGSPGPQDRLYINQGGSFQLKRNALPPLQFLRSCVRAADVDADGDMDLFVGGRAVGGRYPESPASYLLLNKGNGQFTDATMEWAPEWKHSGMITDALWMDLNQDQRPDLIVCGEWMGIQCWMNEGGKLRLQKEDALYKLTGWWNRLHAFDADGDGDMDLVAGNWGTNSQIRVNEKEPVSVYYKDYDGNGSLDPVIGYFIEGKNYPMATRDEMTDQITSWRQRFPTYDSYANTTVEALLDPEQRKQSDSLRAIQFETIFIENLNGRFVPHPLPAQANWSPVHAIATGDFNGDGKQDILLGGNTLEARIKIGRMDANYGILLTGNGKGGFTYVPQTISGLSVQGQTRSIVPITIAGNKTLVWGITQSMIRTFNY